jgi:isochorismate synthase
MEQSSSPYQSLPAAGLEPGAPAPDLLAQYGAGDFYLRTPHRHLLARGVLAPVVTGRGADLPAAVAHHLSEAARQTAKPLVVGAVGFDASTAPALIVAREVWETEIDGSFAVGVAPHDGRSAPPSALRSVRPRPEPGDYVRAVDCAHAALEAGRLRKVVLARAVDIETSRRLDPRRVLAELARRNSSGFVFAVDLPTWSPSPRTLVGASPELLVARRGRTVISNPLAGSAQRSADPREDQARARALLESPKDRHEHALVIEDLAARLAPRCRRLTVPDRPSLLATPTMWHLSSRIEGELADPRLSSLALALALHPTPAVCGSPTEVARGLIAELEPFSRGYYSGLVGWCDASGDGEWAVTLRCAELAGAVARLYAGAGIVLGSQGDRELAETSAKLRTMLDALGADPGAAEAGS